MPLTLKIHIHAGGGTTFAGERVLDGERVTVGRSKDCTLCLDDPEKYLSRIQAELVCCEDGYLLKATSKHSPVLLNGEALGIDSEVMVRAGDTVTMDIYDLEIVGVGPPEGDPDATTIVPEADPEATMIFGGLSRSPKAFQAGQGVRAVPPAAALITGLQAGQVLGGRFRVEATLVASGMGTVYRAHDQLHSIDIALRMMPPELVASDQAKQRFTQEVKAAIQLKHPNIVSTYDVLTDAEHVFLTMELLLGQTLRAAMEERKRTGRKWSEPEVLALIRPLCEALTYAHQVTVHRDIRPENVWLLDGGAVKLMDFGLAPGLPEGETTRQGPATGAAAGYYMAPEQLARSSNVDHRADQYALGVMLYELLAGRMPAGRIESLGALRADVSSGLSAAVDKALSANPADRFGSDAQFLVALRAPRPLAAPASAPASTSARPADAAAGRLKRLGMGVAVVAAALVLFLQWPMLTGYLPDGEAQKQIEQKIARLDGEAKALLKMVEGDQRELKEAVASANRDVERIAGQLRAARSSVERASLDLAQREARNTARLITALENKLRDQTEGPQGLPKAEGNLSAAATAAKRADQTGAIRLLEETVGSLTLMRASISEDRKTAQAAQQRRGEELRIAEARAIKEEEARQRAEAEAKAKHLAESEARTRAALSARARAESEARARAAVEAAARAESEARAKAESDAKARAESEARSKAGADARRRMENEARAIELRAKADADARARAEGEARARADAEARARMEADARTREASAKSPFEQLLRLFDRE